MARKKCAKETAKKDFELEVMAFNFNNLQRPNILNSSGLVSECYVNEVLDNVNAVLENLRELMVFRYHLVLSMLEIAGVSEQRMRDLVSQDHFDLKEFNQEMKTYMVLNTGVNELLQII